MKFRKHKHRPDSIVWRRILDETLGSRQDKQYIARLNISDALESVPMDMDGDIYVQATYYAGELVLMAYCDEVVDPMGGEYIESESNE